MQFDRQANQRSGHTRYTVLMYLLIAVFAPAELFSVPAIETPRRGGTLRLAFSSDWRSLDPAIAFDTESSPLQKLLFRGLIDFDDGIQLKADQAKDWNISPDGKTYTFHLKPTVRFSNGREVEAEDYVFSLERLLNPKTGAETQTYFLDILGAKEFRDGKATHVAGLRAPDRRTFVIELKEPRFTFRYILAMNAADVLPRDEVQKYGADFQYHMSGTGPYRIVEWRRGIRYRFERNPFYTGSDGNVDAVEIMIGGDPTLHAMMIERGELDRSLATAPDVVRFEHNPRLSSLLQRVPTANTDYFFMNTELKPFDDVRVRRAVSHAINVPRLVKLMKNFGVQGQGIVPPSMPWANPGLDHCEYNPEKAKALLREAGLEAGFKTQLWYIAVGPIYKRLAVGIEEDLRKVGIVAELKSANSEMFIVKSGTRQQVPCGVSGWFEDYPDPSDFLDPLLNGTRITASDCNNLAFYNNPAVNTLLERANNSLDTALRTRLFQESENLIMKDAPWVPLLHEEMPRLNSARLRGTQPHPVWLWRYERMWLNE